MGGQARVLPLRLVLVPNFWVGGSEAGRCAREHDSTPQQHLQVYKSTLQSQEVFTTAGAYKMSHRKMWRSAVDLQRFAGTRHRASLSKLRFGGFVATCGSAGCCAERLRL